jgi:hypothetical protein
MPEENSRSGRSEYSALMMESGRPTELSVTLYRTTRRHVAENIINLSLKMFILQLRVITSRTDVKSATWLSAISTSRHGGAVV